MEWTCEHVSAQSLANADDKVQCAFCRGIISDWKQGDRPLEKHSLEFPLCPFLMEMDVGNVPIGLDPIKNPNNIVCGNELPIDMIVDRQNYHTYEARVASFNSHEHLFPINIKLIAEAGLFYSGPGDRVNCFRCFGGLVSFEADDDPWVEHAPIIG
ncbi:unnamed protein product [Medioppia subpectinata]|uniref:Uncharacterized protein n=1 Tax=Medioppia subpectinata TaxID=1979941 RepID=A0A7R9KL85_9ACAR|nr:unnamed protein product [Medioppia subpectinata]CAG2104517.1 unnamed protein product [Medioppia subpectinata]